MYVLSGDMCDTIHDTPFHLTACESDSCDFLARAQRPLYIKSGTLSNPNPHNSPLYFASANAHGPSITCLKPWKKKFIEQIFMH